MEAAGRLPEEMASVDDHGSRAHGGGRRRARPGAPHPRPEPVPSPVRPADVPPVRPPGRPRASRRVVGRGRRASARTCSCTPRRGEALDEHEWVADLRVPRVDGRGRERRWPSSEEERLVRVADGVTLAHVHRTSCRVRTLCGAWARRPLEAWDDDRAAVTLTDEQRAVVARVAGGARLTLLARPRAREDAHGDGARGVRAAVVGPVPRADAQGALGPAQKVPAAQLMTAQRLARLTEPPAAQLVIVDETSMMTMAQVCLVLEAYQRARILFLGDDAQLPCIGRGLPIRDLQEDVHTLRLTRCMRTEGASLPARSRAACARAACRTSIRTTRRSRSSRPPRRSTTSSACSRARRAAARVRAPGRTGTCRSRR